MICKDTFSSLYTSECQQHTVEGIMVLRLNVKTKINLCQNNILYYLNMVYMNIVDRPL